MTTKAVPNAVRGALLGVLLLVPAAAAGAQTSGASAPSPAVAERLNKVAEALFARRDSGPATVRELQSILADGPMVAEAHFLLGVAYAMRGTPELLGEARAELSQAIDLKPTLLQARAYLAELYLQLGRIDPAREQLEAALAQVPGNPRLLTLLAEVERQAGKPDRALEVADQTLAADPTMVQARFYRALALLDLKRTDEGTAELEKVAAARPPDASVYVRLGQLYIDANAPAKAIVPLRQGLAIAPSDTTLHLLLARALRLTNDLAGADAELALARPAGDRMQASGADQQNEAELFAERGFLRLAQKRLPEAAQSFRQALTILPDYGPGEHGLARVLLQQGAYADAATHARRAAELGLPLSAADQATLRARTAAKTTPR